MFAKRNESPKHRRNPETSATENSSLLLVLRVHSTCDCFFAGVCNNCLLHFLFLHTTFAMSSLLMHFICFQWATFRNCVSSHFCIFEANLKAVRYQNNTITLQKQFCTLGCLLIKRYLIFHFLSIVCARCSNEGNTVYF